MAANIQFFGVFGPGHGPGQQGPGPQPGGGGSPGPQAAGFMPPPPMQNMTPQDVFNMFGQCMINTNMQIVQLLTMFPRD